MLFQANSQLNIIVKIYYLMLNYTNNYLNVNHKYKDL
jgi:hypothetical protein